MTPTPAPAAALLPTEQLAQPGLLLDLSRHNPRLAEMDCADIPRFEHWLKTEMARAGCTWGLGGYGEDRALYAMSSLFGDGQDIRSVHLGLDLWLPAGTAVFAPWDAVVHSIGNNTAHGDYGPTVLLEHRSETGVPFFSLYGHLAADSIRQLQPGQVVSAGDTIARIGQPHENVGWVPHLHFQIMRNIGDARGDFPGVCLASQRARWLENCLDPLPVLRPYCPQLVAGTPS